MSFTRARSSLRWWWWWWWWPRWRMRRASVRRVRMRRARVRRVTRVSLSHSQRGLVAQEVGIVHQVSYSSSVSILCQNEIKDRNYKSVQQHIFISFSFSGKKMVGPLCSMSFLLEIFHRPPPPPALNHSREKEWPPQNHHSPPSR